MRIYVASSWRNPYQAAVVDLLRQQRHEVYDFRHPTPGRFAEKGDLGFHWSSIEKGWRDWTPETYVKALSHPSAVSGFESDKGALDWCDACICVLPCGRSAHLELGYAIGRQKRSAVLLPDPALPLTPMNGHSMSSAPCSTCGDLDGCHVPANLRRIEPELMNKLADRVALSMVEILDWLNSKN